MVVRLSTKAAVCVQHLYELLLAA